MKTCVCLAFACLFAFASCSTGTNKEKNADLSINSLDAKLRIDTGIMVKDTFFINRTTDVKGHIVHVIYIDPDKSLNARVRIFNWSSNDSANLRNYLNQLKKGKHALIHATIGDFPKDWRPVYQYHGKYYLYDPNDTAGNNTMIVTDSLLMPYFFGDGYTPFAIQSFIRNNSRWVTIKTTHYAEIEETAFGEVNVYTIDPKTGLSVWIIGNDAELMVPRQGVSNYPVIVNRSVFQKYDELEFDKINAKKLISK